MKKNILLVLTLTMLLHPVISSAQNASQDSFNKEMQMMHNGKNQKAFIEKVAQQAREKDTAAIMAEMVSSVVKTIGEANIINDLQTKVFPFFAPYIKLHNYEQITIATLPDGRSGLWHYTYISSAEEKMLPFRIAVIDTDDGPKILNIVVNECVRGRHPICK